MTDPREALVALLGRPDHAPMSTHDPRDGSCQSCPWPLHEMPPEDIADAILSEFDVTPRGEGDATPDKAVTPATAYRVARWQHTRWFEPHPARPTDVYLRPEGGTGAHALYAGCRDCDEVLLPETFESIPLPSVEDVARACGDPGSITPRREGESVPRWSARAVLALLPGRTEAEVKVEVLRDAADDVVAEEFLRALPPAEYGENAVESAAAWLRDRAARIEKGEGRG